MKRRAFIAGLGGAAVVGLRGAGAQQRTVPVVGFLSPISPREIAARPSAHGSHSGSKRSPVHALAANAESRNRRPRSRSMDTSDVRVDFW